MGIKICLGQGDLRSPSVVSSYLMFLVTEKCSNNYSTIVPIN